MSEEILTTGDAARRLDVSGEYIRKLTRDGRISALRTVSGQYLFESSEIERLVREREAKKQSAQEGGNGE